MSPTAATATERPASAPPRPAGAARPTVRPLRVGVDGHLDDAAVRDIFLATLVLGRPLPHQRHPVLDRYADLCLGWYLGAGRPDAALVEDGDGPAGYALVCADGPAHRRWTTRRAIRFGAGAALAAARPGCPAAVRSFVGHRARDAAVLVRGSAAPPAPVHAHLNLRPGVRATWAGRQLADHVDAVCRRVGALAWYGEINAPAGRRAAALERLGGEVVARAPNRTLSALLGAEVERLTVVRHLPV